MSSLSGVIGRTGLVVLGCFVALNSSMNADAAQDKRRYALVNVPVASVFSTPQPYSERVTQVLFAEPVLRLFDKGGWTRVLVVNQYRTDRGYPGWILSEYLSDDISYAGYYDPHSPSSLELPCEELEPDESTFSQDSSKDMSGGWPQGLLTIIQPKVALYSQPNSSSAPNLSLYGSTQLRSLEFDNGWYKVKMPKPAQPLYIKAESVVEGYLPDHAPSLLQTAFRYMDVPYVWGGMSPLGIDCSGFVYVCCKIHGFILPRDADQQSQIGEDVLGQELLPGDLLFFGSSQEKVTHVGFYLGEGNYLDASGKRGVSVSELSSRRLVAARRVLTPGKWDLNK